MSLVWPEDALESDAKMRWPSHLFDVRVRELPEPRPPSDRWHGSVSINDLLGGTLVTFPEDILSPEDTALRRDLGIAAVADDGGLGEEKLPPVTPKTIYVQYTCPDPVTGDSTRVVVPAELSLDVYGRHQPVVYFTPEPEETPEESIADSEEEARRKLRSSIKGDPILMRAKPANPPDPHFPAPRRPASEFRWRPQTVSPSAHSGASGSAALAFPGNHGVVTAGLPGSPLLGSSEVDTSTMSSFLKAGGKDRYSRAPLGEIDAILRRTTSSTPSKSPMVGPSPVVPPTVDPLFSLSMADSDAETVKADPGVILAADLAVRIGRIPNFHKSGGRAPDVRPSSTAEMAKKSKDSGMSENGSKASLHDGDMTTQSATLRVAPPHRAQVQAQPHHLAATTAAVVAPMSAQTAAAVTSPRLQHTARVGSIPRKPLRALDPHLDLKRPVSFAQRLHSNWPDGLRRQLARHFYGMSPRQILEDEEQERMQERLLQETRRFSSDKHGKERRGNGISADDGSKAATGATEEIGAGGARATGGDVGPGGHADSSMGAGCLASVRKGLWVGDDSPRTKAKLRNLERSLVRGAEGGLPLHNLEIKITNSKHRAHRVVVGRSTTRPKGETAPRSCMLLNELQSNPKALSKKY